MPTSAILRSAPFRTSARRLARLCGTVLTLALLLQPSEGDDTKSYSQSDDPETLHPDWMKWVPDSTPLNLVAVPATHDTMARFGGDLAETQQLTLEEQLNSGIRAFDIRTRLKSETFHIYHGDSNQHATFDEVLETCETFLEQYPSETIILDVKNESGNFLDWWAENDPLGDDPPTDDDWSARMQQYRTALGTRLWSGSYPWKPNMGAVRGKIVIHSDLGWPNQAATMYNVKWTWNIGKRWADNWMFFLYMDGEVASYTPRESPGGEEGAVQLDENSDDILYNPSISGTSENGGVYPYDVANSTNPKALEWLFGGNQNRLGGLFQADFPGGALISATLAHNMKRVALTAPAIASLSPDFDAMWEMICHSADAGGRSTSMERVTALKVWLDHILPDHYWGVIGSGATSPVDWGYHVFSDGLSQVSPEIDGWKYVAVNALALSGGITSAEVSAYLTDARLQTLSGTAQERADSLRSLLWQRFPGRNWNLTVKRVAASGGWGSDFDASASVANKLVTDDGQQWFYTAWTTSVYNLPPVAHAGGTYTAVEGATVLLNASGSQDPDGAALTFRWDFDSNGTWDHESPLETVSHAFPNEGTWTVRLAVSDQVHTVETTTTVTVTNAAPVVNLGANSADIPAGGSLSRSCFFTDPGSDTWTVTVDYGDGSPVQTVTHFSKAFTINRTYSTAGTRTVTVTVHDGATSRQGIITVNVAAAGNPAILDFTGPTGPVPEGSPVTVNGSFYHASWTLSVSINWGDGSAAVQPVVLAQGNGNYTFTAQHTYPNPPPGGSSNYTVTATWPGWDTRTLSVTMVDVPPAFSSLTVPAVVAEGAAVQVGYTIVAPTQDVLTKRVAWGDGTFSSWVGGPLSASSPPHTYLSAGTYQMLIQVTDEDLSTDMETRTITVTDATPSIFSFDVTTPGVSEGGTASVTGVFQSPNLANDQFTVEIDWGDGQPRSIAPYFSVGGNTAQFSASHVYRDNNGPNHWTATLTLTDDDGSTATRTVLIPVGNQPPAVDAIPNFSIPSGTPLDLPGHITDPGSDTFTGTVNYGDGTGVQPLNITGNTYVLSHTYAVNGPRTITVTVNDDDGASSSRTLQVLVGPVRDLLVTNTSDSGPGSLRQAVLDANTPSSNSSTFPGAYADIRFSPALSGQTVVLTSGQLLSSLRTRILAGSLPAGIRISGNNTGRILQVATGNAVVLESVHLTNGLSAQGGGAILVDQTAALELHRCSITGCSTTDRGGGIYFVKGSSLLLSGTTVSGCTARNGGGVYFYGLGGKVMQCDNSTFSGNTATGTAASQGGAIFNESGVVLLQHTTISGNTAAGSSAKGGGVHSSPDAQLEATYSIIAGNTGTAFPNISGPVTGTGNLTAGDPMLYPLGNYGGPVMTMPPLPESPAVDALGQPEYLQTVEAVAAWRMGESDPGAAHGSPSAGTANELGGSLLFNTPATFTSSVSPAAAGWLDSRLALQFSSGTHASGDVVTGLTDNFGLELWVKPDTAAGTQCLAYNGSSAASGWGLYLLAGKYQGLIGGRALLEGPTAIPGVWTHLALVRDSGVMTLYINGTATATSAVAPGVPAGRFALGVQPQTLSAEFFAGSMDEVRVFGVSPGLFTPADLQYQPSEPIAHSLFLTVDQRGLRRVANGAADIGAVEVQQAAVRVKDDSGNGSLRSTLASIAPAGIVTFTPALGGQTIVLGSEIAVQKNGLLLDGDGLAAGVMIDGGPGTGRILTAAAGTRMTARALTFTGGSGGGADSPQLGGAVFNRGALTFDRCTFTANSALYGAALFNEGGGNLTLTRCTLAGNQAGTEAGAIYNRGTLSLQDVTIAANSAVWFGGVYNDNGSTCRVANTIIAANTGTSGADMENRGTLIREGQNLIQSVVGGGPITGPLHLSSAPQLAPLGYYGGLTASMPLTAGSPARDAGTLSPFTTDQRGFPRVVGAAADLGAYEAGTFANCDIWIWESLPATATPAQHAATFDFDGDGQTNGDEWLYLTNPASGASFFNPALSTTGATLTLTFPSVTGRTYILEQNASLTPGAWTPAGVAPLSGNGAVLQFTIPISAARNFYRIRVSP